MKKILYCLTAVLLLCLIAAPVSAELADPNISVSVLPSGTIATINVMNNGNIGGNITAATLNGNNILQNFPITALPVGISVPAFISDLSPGTPYTVSVTFTPDPGEPVTRTADFTIPTIPTAPTITELSVDNVGYTTADLTFCYTNGTENIIAANLNIISASGGMTMISILPNLTGSPVTIPLTDLSPGEMYMAQVSLTNEGGMSSLPMMIPFTTPSMSPTISEIAVSDITDTNATITFSYTEGISSISDATLSMNGGMTDISQYLSNGNATVPVTNLTPGTDYLATVLLTNENDFSSSNNVSFAATGVAPVPIHLQTAFVNHSAASLLLTYENDAVFTAATFIFNGTSEDILGNFASGSPMTIDLTGLMPRTEYMAIVEVTEESGLSGTAITVFTTTTSPVPPAITEVTYTNLAETSVDIQFSYTNSADITNASLIVSDISGGVPMELDILSDLTDGTATVPVTGLTPGTSYMMIVFLTDEEMMPASHHIYVTIPALSAEYYVSSIGVTENSAGIVIVCTNGTADVTSAELTLMGGAPEDISSYFAQGSPVTVPVTGLDYGSRYDGIIAITDSNGSGTQLPISFSTIIPVFLMIESVSYTDVTETSAEISISYVKGITTTLTNATIRLHGGEPQDILSSFTGSPAAVELTGLTAGTHYSAEIELWDDLMSYPVTIPVYFSTLKSLPPPPPTPMDSGADDGAELLASVIGTVTETPAQEVPTIAPTVEADEATAEPTSQAAGPAETAGTAGSTQSPAVTGATSEPTATEAALPVAGMIFGILAAGFVLRRE